MFISYVRGLSARDTGKSYVWLCPLFKILNVSSTGCLNTQSVMSTILKHLKQRKRGHSFRQKSTRSSKRRLLQSNNNQIWNETNSGGVFTFLPLEVCHLIFRSTPLKAMGMLSLTSRTLRDLVAAYIYSPQSADVIVPAFVIDRNGGIFTASLECHSHYKNLGEYQCFEMYLQVKNSLFL